MKTTVTMQNTPTGQPAVSTIAPIAIGRLAISPLNVRKRAPGGIAELADLIKSQGLIHNLVVTEQQKKKKKTGKYEVVAGGRRLAALKLLVAEGRLSDADEVNCRIVSMTEALEMSLAENSGREAMHPADLVIAYRNLTQAGLAPDEIAPRFGVSPLTVKRYLKLTHVSPALFALYADDQINFEQISALALPDDHDLQERLWNDTSEWQRNGATFRRLITGSEIDITSHPLARFVGVERISCGRVDTPRPVQGLRMSIEKVLNGIEHVRRFTRAVSVGSPREFVNAEKEDQKLAEACKPLIKNCIVCWNYLYLSQQFAAIDDPAKCEEFIQALRHRSAASCRHVNLQGEYYFSPTSGSRIPSVSSVQN